MSAFEQLPPLTHLQPLFAAVAGLNPHDGPARSYAMDPRRSMVLLAPAGAGKTTTLQLRLLSCLTTVERPEEVLAITFTNKAAAEIVERVVGALLHANAGVEPEKEHELIQYRLARLVLERDKQMGWNLLLNPSRLRIMTFDSFCAFLAGKTPIMSGIGGGKTTEDASRIYRPAILDTLKSVNDDDIPEALSLALHAVLGFAKNRFELLVPMFETLLAKRDQWAGKIMSLDIEGMQTAVSALITQAADEAITCIKGTELESCMDTLREANDYMQGFEWANVKPILNTDPDCLAYLRTFADFMTTGEGSVRAVVNVKNGFPAKHPMTKQMNEALTAIKQSGRAAEYSQALQTLATLPDTVYPERAAEMSLHFTIILRYLLANLTLTFESTNSLDFPEIAQRAIQSLGDDVVVGDALLDEDRITHIMVDEFQDTNQAQYDLLTALTAHWDLEDGRSLFFCGDGFQSIYLFRGADLNLFTSLVEKKSFGAKPLEVHRLVVNFRSAPGIVNWNNEAYAEVFKNSEYPYVPSVPFQTGEGGVHVHAFPTGPIGEGQEVAAVVKRVLQESPEKSIAILVRGRSHLKFILPELKAAGIEVTGQDIDPIGSSAPVSEVIALTRALWHKADRASWLTLLRAAFVGLSWSDTLAVAQGGSIIHESLKSEAVRAQLSTDGLARVQSLLAVLDGVDQSSRGNELAWAVKSAWIALGGPASVNAGEMDDIETIFRLLTEHTSTGDLVDPHAFFRAIDNVYASPKAGSVTVMTLHKSKGLEFDCVLIPGLSRGKAPEDSPLFYWRQVEGTFTIVPNLGDLDETTPASRLFKFVGKMVRKDIALEIGRTAYVGTTRAKQDCHLFVSVTKLTDEDGEIKPTSGSLLECLWPVLGEQVNNVNPGVPITAEFDTGVPSKARLVPGFVVQLPKSVFVPAASNDQIPTENELNDDLREEEGSDYRAKTVGIVYHWFVEQIGKQGLDSWTVERVRSKAQAVASMLRRGGYPAAEVSGAVARIIELVVTTITSDAGRWILKTRPGSGQEVQVSAYRNGRWIHRYLDLTFVEDKVYWIGDLKSAVCPEGVSEEVFIAREIERYRAKMLEYKQGVIDAGVTDEVKMFLFFASLNRLAEVA